MNVPAGMPVFGFGVVIFVLAAPNMSLKPIFAPT
jgi:hypothetical protein